MRFQLPLTLLLLLTSMTWAQQEPAPNSLTEADKLNIAVQKICPVSGQALGSMGTPVKVQVGQQTAFLCCQACTSKKLSAEQWKQVMTNLAAAQGTCPIMGKPVDASMKTTVVEGQLIFVCCPPCIDKIQAAPDEAIKKVQADYASHLQQESERLQAAAQAICPVSGKPLGSMGDPVKVKVSEQTAFLCCQGCVNQQLDRNHWATAQANLAKAQGTCPVMGKPVDASMKSAIVKGRKIFVCCPPCIEKIEADAVSYLAQVNAQIEKHLAQRDADQKD